MSLEEKVTMLSGVQAQELNLPNIEKIDPDKPIFSFSRFKTYMSCPAQYDFVYNKKRERSKDIVLSIGSTVHYLAERYSAEVIKGNTPTPEELELIGKEYWKTESQSLVETDLQKLEGFEEAYKLFNVYLPELQKVKPKMVEQHILYYPPGKEWGIQGVIDRIDDDDSLCDIKTASKAPPKKSKYSSDHALLNMHEEQLATYKWMAREELGITVKRGYIDYIVKSSDSRVIRVEAELSAQMEKSVINMFDRVYDAVKCGAYPPNRTSTYCSSTKCPHWVECTGLPNV